MTDKRPRLLDGAPYQNAASHQTSEGLRERFAKINATWNKKPERSNVTAIKTKRKGEK